ncbi:hypothetical protein SO802_033526 [Lithocarpus litseifolius]|uniref:Uncharacterized protein n=1 Tax=Lithocarpus litseifolius TaxID=425828 RepID=A0AAW2BD71_9ROSI
MILGEETKQSFKPALGEAVAVPRSMSFSLRKKAGLLCKKCVGLVNILPWRRELPHSPLIADSSERI